MQKFQKVRFFEKINDSEHFGEEPVLSKKTTKTTKKKKTTTTTTTKNIYICVYIYVAIGEKQRHSTFIPISLIAHSSGDFILLYFIW